jgi:hypothetical protein
MLVSNVGEKSRGARSMLDQQIPQVHPSRVTNARPDEHADRAMDVLQYGMALFAIAVAALLAVIR